jgi:hypothetical protein
MVRSRTKVRTACRSPHVSKGGTLNVKCSALNYVNYLRACKNSLFRTPHSVLRTIQPAHRQLSLAVHLRLT